MKPEREPATTVPDPMQVRDALARIAASEEFRASPQLIAFLRFVTEAALAGGSDRIKAYTIGVEAFGRGAGFDPQIDPIVRVEATRLRRTMARYYAGTGAIDPVIIELSRGSYVPSFTFRGGDVAAAASGQRLPGGTPRPKWLVLPAAAVILIAVGFFAPKIRLEWSSSPSATSATPAGDDRGALAALHPGNGLPTLLVQPFEILGTADPRSISAPVLHDRISDAFSRFDLVNVIWDPMLGGADSGSAPSPPRQPVDYRLIGSVQYVPGAASIRFRLIDAIDDAVIWARVFDERVGDNDQQTAAGAIVRELTATLVEPFGVIYAYGRRQAATRGIGDPRYRCLLDAIETFRSFDSRQTLQARSCLERLTAVDPTFALGWTYLAALHLREYFYDLDAEPSDLPPLERALRAARRGVELNPAGARAHEMLFAALFARRDVAAAFVAGDKAIALNRHDMRILGAYGARKVAVGEIDLGMELLRRAGGDGTLVPAFEQFFQFVGSYMGDDLARATFHAGQLTGDTFPLGLIARAIVAWKANDRDAARNALDRLAALNPAWRRNLHGELEKFFYADTIVARLAADLEAAGLVSAN
jgi:TolB-like protein/tetratricopeptide (TPR) repeat protein